MNSSNQLYADTKPHNIAVFMITVKAAMYFILFILFTNLNICANYKFTYIYVHCTMILQADRTSSTMYVYLQFRLSYKNIRTLMESCLDRRCPRFSCPFLGGEDASLAGIGMVWGQLK